MNRFIATASYQVGIILANPTLTFLRTYCFRQEDEIGPSTNLGSPYKNMHLRRFFGSILHLPSHETMVPTFPRTGYNPTPYLPPSAGRLILTKL